MIQVLREKGGERFRILNFYTPAEQEAYCTFLEELTIFLLRPLPLILVGDFHCILEEGDSEVKPQDEISLHGY